MWGASDESDIVPMHCLHCFSSSPPQPCAVYHLIIIFCSNYFCFLSNEKVFQYIAIIVLPFPSPLMLLGPQKWLINETKCLELGWESRDGPMRKMFSNPLSFPHTGTSLHLKYEMGLMIKSCLSVPPTLVPETAVSNLMTIGSQSELQLRGEKQRENRGGWGSAMGPLNPVVSLGPLRPSCRAQGIVSVESSHQRLSQQDQLLGCVWTVTQPKAWWHAQTATQQTHRVCSSCQNFFKTEFEPNSQSI